MRPHSSSSTSRPPASRATAAADGIVRRDHRDRRGQGARRRDHRRVRHPGRPAAHHPAADRRTHRDHHRDGARCPDHRRRCCRCSWSSPTARCWWRTTPDSTSGFSGPPPSNAASPGPSAGAVHGAAGAPGAQPRGGAQRPAVRTGPAVRLRHRAHPPGTRRRPRDRRRAARADRAGGQPGRDAPTAICARICPTVSNAQRGKRVLASGLPHRPGVYLFRGPTAEVLYVGTATDLRRRVRPVLHRRRSARPDEGDGGASPQRSTTSNAPMRWRPGCANCGCWPPTPRRTTAGRAFRTGGGGWC